MHHAINEYQLRLDVQRFLWPVYYIAIHYLYYAGPIFCILGCNFTLCRKVRVRCEQVLIIPSFFLYEGVDSKVWEGEGMGG